MVEKTTEEKLKIALELLNKSNLIGTCVCLSQGQSYVTSSGEGYTFTMSGHYTSLKTVICDFHKKRFELLDPKSYEEFMKKDE